MVMATVPQCISTKVVVLGFDAHGILAVAFQARCESKSPTRSKLSGSMVEEVARTYVPPQAWIVTWAQCTSWIAPLALRGSKRLWMMRSGMHGQPNWMGIAEK